MCLEGLVDVFYTKYGVGGPLVYVINLDKLLYSLIGNISKSKWYHFQ